MNEYNAIFKNNHGKNFHLKWNVAKIAGRWHGFSLKEGMIYGIAHFKVKGDLTEKDNYLYVYTGKSRVSSSNCKQILVFIQNDRSPKSAYFGDWHKVWIDVREQGITARLFWSKPEVRDYAEYFPDYSKPRNNQLSYQPAGGKSVGAQFEYNAYGIVRTYDKQNAKRR